MGGKEKEGRVGGRGRGRRGGERERMWRGPESGLPRGPCWLSVGLGEGGGRGRKEGGKGMAIKTPLLNGLATGLSESCIVSEIKQDSGRKSRCFHNSFANE